MVTAFTNSVVEIVKNIPRGKVITYGMVALCAGSPHGARQVSWILHSSSTKYDLPWHRVVNRQGKIALRSFNDGSLQRQLLEKEGVIFNAQEQIDLAKYLWWP